MPQITPLGVARQTTLMAKRTTDAVEDALNLVGEEREERIRDAKVFAKEVSIWMEFAAKRGWNVVVRHSMTQLVLASAALERLL